MYKTITNFDGVQRISDGALIPSSGGNTDYEEYLAWVNLGNTPTEDTPVTPTQFELDQNRYKKRAEVQSELLAYMAADNMSRVRSGTWSVSQLTSLLDDPSVKAAQTYMSTLSFELAAQAIQGAATPLLTPEIKADWVSRLQAAFFLVP